MAYSPDPMGTLLIPSGPGNHLFVIMNPACKDGMHLLFSISSIKPKQKYDTACEFKGGEHPFITKPSFVYYREPQKRSTSNLEKCVEGKLFIPKDALDEIHFDRIRAGILVSVFTKPWVEEYCRANGVID